MSKQLYEEALADIKQLTAAAEDAAKREVLEAVAPRIRSLIEQQMFGDSALSTVQEEEETDLLLGGEEDVVPAGSVSIAPDGDLVIDLDALGKEEEVAPLVPSIDDEEVFDLGSTAVQPISLANENKLSIKDIELSLYKLSNLLESYKHISDKFVTTNVFKEKIDNMITGVQNTYEYVQEAVTDPNKKLVLESKLENCFKDLQNLQEKAMNLKGLLREEDEITLKLTGVEVIDPDEASVEIEIPDDDTDIESDEDLELSDEEDSDDELVSDDEELDLGDSEEETETEDEELDLGDSEEEETDEDEDEYAPKFESTSKKNDVIVEIDDKLLTREITKLRKINETVNMAAPVKKTEEPVEEADEYMEEIDEAETCEEDKPATSSSMAENIKRSLNKYAVERKVIKKNILENKAKYVHASKFGKTKLSESIKQQINVQIKEFNSSLARSKKLSGILHEDTNKRDSNSTSNVVTDLKKKLAESNLNNVKLAIVNKLLQNNNLSAGKQAQIAEQLDKARTVREAQLIYQNVVKLTKQNMTESTRRSSASGSRPVQSGQPSTLNENIELARWSKIAGISK